MMRHRDVRNLLYDYIQTEMDPLLKDEIERHLASCEACSRDLRTVMTVLSALPQEVEPANVAMDQKDWDSLYASITQKVQDAQVDSNRFSWSEITAPRYAIAAAVAIAVLGLLWLLRTPVGDHTPSPRETVQTPAQEQMELGRYFRKSRALLTGLSNLEPPPDSPIDLSVERKISRQLMIEGRSLRGQKLDPRSDRLIGDLDRIMELVSLAPEAAQPPDIQTIRSDIRGQNLLVKLRVAETSYAGVPQTHRGEGL